MLACALTLARTYSSLVMLLIWNFMSDVSDCQQQQDRLAVSNSNILCTKSLRRIAILHSRGSFPRAFQKHRGGMMRSLFWCCVTTHKYSCHMPSSDIIIPSLSTVGLLFCNIRSTEVIVTLIKVNVVNKFVFITVLYFKYASYLRRRRN